MPFVTVQLEMYALIEYVKIHLGILMRLPLVAVGNPATKLKFIVLIIHCMYT